MPGINGVPTAICRICGSYYTDGFWDDTHAHECAAGQRRAHGVEVVVCHYGSAHDGNVYRLASAAVDWHGAAPICDGCINSATRLGLLTYWYNELGLED